MRVMSTYRWNMWFDLSNLGQIPHAAFRVDEPEGNVAPRASIEVRVMLLFHEAT